MAKVDLKKNVSIAASQFVNEKKYWNELLKNNWDRAEIPYNLPDLKKEKISSLFKFKIEGDIFNKIVNISNKSDHRLEMFFLSIISILVKKYSGISDMVIGTPVERQKSSSDLINKIIPIMIQMDFNDSFKQLLIKIKDSVINSIQNQNYPIETILYDLDLEDTSDLNPLFDVAVVIKNIHEKEFLDKYNTNLIFSFLRTDSYIECEIDYNENLYDNESIKNLTVHLTELITAVFDDLDAKIDTISILSDNERNIIENVFNKTSNKVDGKLTLSELFEKQVEKTPDEIALQYNGIELKYRELNSLSNHFANQLLQEGVNQNTLISLLLKPSIEMAVAILGVLKAGCAYLPMDVNHPQSILEEIIKEHKIDTIISHISINAPDNVKQIVINKDKLPAEECSNLNINIDPESSAYIIFTSGTTGIPKGVTIRHKGLVNMLEFRKNEYKFDISDVCLNLFSYTFDGFVTSFFTPILSGSKVILLDKESVFDIKIIQAVIKEQKVTHFICIPHLFNAIIDNVEAIDLSSLRVITLAGDKLNNDLIDKVNTRLADIEIVNEYGVSEATVLSTIFRNQQKDSNIKVGKPIWNTKIYVVDDLNNMTPIGIPGEIIIDSIGLSKGYLNNDGLTKEKFIQNPFNEKSIVYKTGDVGRWLPDGSIQLMGRKDLQVKIRGFRIELEYIEQKILKFDSIEQAIVLAESINTGDHALYAFIVPTKDYDQTEFKQFLQEDLPDYMIPRNCFEIEEIPVTGNGKIDRKKLRKLISVNLSNREYIEPKTEMQKKIAELWRSNINVEKISINDNYFNIGGDSIKCISLLNSINQEFNANLKIADLYENENIVSLENFLANTVKENVDTKEIENELNDVKEQFLLDL